MNYAGVTIDFYDDKGATIRAKFPEVGDLPSVIKQANVQPKEKISNDDFALIALDNGHVIRKFACHDPGTTAMSVIYLMEHGDKLPQEAVKQAAANLVERCVAFGMEPPKLLKKAANITAPDMRMQLSTAIDTTGRQPRPIVKEARPARDQDYAVVLPDGRRFYPIDTFENVKLAANYFMENSKRMEPPIRRQFAVKLAARAQQISCHIDDSIKEAGAVTWAPTGELCAYVNMRKRACADGNQRAFLDDLLEKRATVGPDMYAECLHRFDIESGMSHGWDRFIPDPWASTFGIQKVADEIVWEDGADRVTKGELLNLVQNRMGLVEKTFSVQFSNEFAKDPVAIFESMPLTQKRILARMASNTAADGGSEQDSEAPAPGEHKKTASVDVQVASEWMRVLRSTRR